MDTKRLGGHIQVARLRSGLLLLVLVAVAALPLMSRAALQSPVSSQPTAVKERRPGSVPGDILVRFRSGSAVAKSGARAVMTIEEGGRQVPVQIESLTPAPEIVPGLRVARVAPEDTANTIEALRSRPDVIYAEPNYIRRALKTPNDPRYPQMWGLKNTGQASTPGGNPGTPGNDIRAEQAWDVTTGSKSVVVGIIDEGIDINHEDLHDNMWTNPGEIPGNGIDDDGNGFVDDVNGWDFAHNDNTVFDYTGPSYPPNPNYSGDVDDHGTHVAGTIGATGNNGLGVTGINWQVSLMSLKFLTGDGGGTSADLLKAFSYVKMMRELWTSSGGTKGANIRVLNNSYGGGGFSQAELEAIRALGDDGILFVVAAGNDGQSNDQFPTYPANYISSNLISVAASTGGGQKASFSNFGPGTVNMTAPGDYILSTTPKNTYNFFSGTSMATPHVAGSAALLCAAFPNISVQRLRSVLLYSGYEAPWQYQYIYPISTGRSMDVNAALQSVISPDTTPPAAVSHLATYSGPMFPNVGISWGAPGDDGNAGKVAAYEIRFSDTDLSDPTKFALATPLPGPTPDMAGTAANVTVRIPWRHPSGFIGVRAMDKVGNAGPITSVPVPIPAGAGDPYTVTESGATPLSTGGTPLGLIADDQYKSYTLPFGFKFYEGDWGGVTISSNGAIYFGSVGTANDSLSSVRWLNGYRIVAGAWDDLRTDRRPGDDVYVVQPDENRIIFRWQAVTYDTPIGPGVSRGENPVNFEIELQSQGTIIIRYGDGNQKLFPVVGLGGGWPEPYPVDSHTSESAFKDLTNAGTVTFALRNPPPPPTSNLSLTMTSGPDPVASGSQETYSIHVFNDGPYDATNTVATDPLPAGSTLVSCTTSQGSCSGPAPGSNGTVSVNLGQLNRFVTVNITIIAKVATAPGTIITNTATVNSSRFDSDTSNNSATATARVVQVSVFGDVAAISSAYFINFALKHDGTVWGWGRNDSGAMGNGIMTSQESTAVQVNNLSGIVAISTGGSHSLALKSDGTVWSWGGNGSGETGGPNATNANPVLVNGLSNTVAISAGASHSMALRNDGTVWVWGGNHRGELGLGTFDDNRHPTPVQVPGVTGVTFIAAGTDFSVVVRNDGSVWAWGENNNGELGTIAGPSSTPAQVNGVSGVRAIAVSFNHVLALKTDGTVMGWGMNSLGQTGSSNFVNVNPTATQVNGLTGVTSVAAGFGFSLALKSDGTVWGWGLPPGTSTQTTNPSMISGITSAIALAAGNSHGLVLLSDGTLRSWGDNAYGQLGDGTTFNRSTPVQVTTYIFTVPPAPTVQFSSSSYTISETGPRVDITLTRAGDTTSSASVGFATNDAAGLTNCNVINGTASPRCDYENTIGTATWAAGDASSKSFSVAIVDDSYAEGSETFTVSLNNPAGATLGAQSTATVTITDNDAVNGANPIDSTTFFVRQQYIDFLGREPDPGGFAGWVNTINNCTGDTTQCDRIHVSQLFFQSAEFQERGYFVYRFYPVAFGRKPDYSEFVTDLARVSGFLDATQLEAAKVQFITDFMARPAFANTYNPLNNTQYVDTLLNTAGVTLLPSPATRQALIDGLNNSTKTRAQVLRQIVESAEVSTKYNHQAYAVMEYFGYLRRQPDAFYLDWIAVLDATNDPRGMVTGFVNSSEYRDRFGP